MMSPAEEFSVKAGNGFNHPVEKCVQTSILNFR